jgi:alkylated DNA repair dioxygenase AlkB
MMTLFDTTEILHAGEKKEVDFTVPDASLKLWEQFFQKEESDRYYRLLLRTTPWAQHRRKMYDKIVADPRLTAWYGKNGNEWTAELLQIKKKVETASGIVFDSVLLNYYRDGNDSVAWHSDTLPSSGRHHAIGSVTFGETRVFKVRRKDNKKWQIEIPLTHGSFLLMGATMQDHYEHHIPKTARHIGPRINLTFRLNDASEHMVSKANSDNH